jgi:putative tricarboxylic transport membrane protein
MRLNDAALGAILIGFAGWVWWLTGFFPAFPGQDYGPNLFPRILAVAIAICGAILVVRGVRSGAPLVAFAAWTREPARLVSFLLIPAGALGYILLGDRLGFIPAAFLLLFGLSLWFRARPLVALPVAAGMTLVVHWFFSSLMRVPLPRGLLDAWL